MPWWLFYVPCPTPDGQTARDLYAKRERWFDDEMRAAARRHGCRFHRAWTAADESAFYAIAYWDSRDEANAFYGQFGIAREPGEQSIPLDGGIGLVALPEDVSQDERHG